MNLLSTLLKPFRSQGHSLSNRDISCVVALNKSQIEAKQQTKEQTIEVKESPCNNIPNNGDLTTLPGVGPKIASILLEAGYKTAEDVLYASNNDLKQIKGIGDTVLSKIRNSKLKPLTK